MTNRPSLTVTFYGPVTITRGETKRFGCGWTKTGRQYEMAATLGMTGAIVVECFCPARRHCEHRTAFENAFRKHPEVTDNLDHEPSLRLWTAELAAITADDITALFEGL
jgi:hypothetical protein